MKTQNFKILKAMASSFCLFILPLSLFAQITNIPDANFEQALIDLGIDSDGIVNGQVLTSDIEIVTTLDINNKGINDITGIEDFAALESLDVSTNFINSLNLTSNSNLKTLVFDNSFNLTGIDVTNNINLEELKSSLSLLSELDLINNINLKELILGEPSPAGNHLIEFLDLRNNTLLNKLQLINLEFLTIVDLRSDNNFILTDVFVECSTDGGFSCEPLPCFMVDDFSAAQNNEFPYSEWDAYIYFSEDCSLGIISSNKHQFSIYPNPVKQTLILNSLNGMGKVNFKIFSTEGKLLSTMSLDFENQTSIDVSNLSNGIYFLNIEDESGNTITKKFIKE